jgi:DNA-directed RNA polymerase II subunit RPB1
MNLVTDYFKLKGITNVSKNVDPIEERYVKFNDDEKAEAINQYKIFAGGNNMYDIRYINNVDVNNTLTNDLMSIYEMFGIEACRAFLIKEIQMIYKTAGSDVNFHHISLLADVMTNNGFLMSIDRHGLNKINAEPLTRASFEKSVHQLITASVFGEVDHMKGVSSRIMGGLVIKGGTGYCNVYLDDELIKNSEFTGKTGIITNELEKDILMEEIMK